jgi:hypothetical protein
LRCGNITGANGGRGFLAAFGEHGRVAALLARHAALNNRASDLVLAIVQDSIVLGLSESWLREQKCSTRKPVAGWNAAARRGDASGHAIPLTTAIRRFIGAARYESFLSLFGRAAKGAAV